MYIIPDSTLYILRNVPLDTTYDHTLWFDTATQQSSYFSSLSKYRLEYSRGNALTYVRVNRGTIKVPYKADDLYDCNYIMFRNTSFGNKWFYAFIRSIEYVNNTTTEITFELDVMQTWHFEYQIDECFVEREHSVRDAVYENTLPENVDLGDYVSNGHIGTNLFTDWVIVVVRACGGGIASPTIGTPATGGFYNGNYQQVEFDIFEPTAESITAINGYLTTLSIFNNENAIQSMFLFPRSFVPTAKRNLSDSLNTGIIKQAFEVVSPPYLDGNIGGYIPKNNKLYTFPYCFLECSNFEGETRVYKYEYFHKPAIGQPIYFSLFSDINVKPSVMLAPVNYMNYYEGEDYQPNLQEGICITNFPSCTFATTDAGAKFVQGLMGVAFGGLNAKTVGQATQQIISYSKRNPATGRLQLQEKTVRTSQKSGGTGGNIGGQIAENICNGIMSSGITANIGSGNIMQSAMGQYGGMDFSFRKLHIREEYLRIIDDYFSCYGYATKRVKNPNRSSRPHWNYVKTIGCTITGSVPCDDMAAICSIYDNGITFWKKGSEVGNYSLDNSPS